MLCRLADAHPDSVAQLTYQYRMHRDICELSNTIVYGGKLKCANEEVANRGLSLSGFPENLLPFTVGNSMMWLNKAIDPDSAMVFLDTDAIRNSSYSESTESIITPLESTAGRAIGGSIVNDTESKLVRITVKGLLDCGLDSSAIGVISPFRAQLRRLEECPEISSWKHAGLEISTIDRYQGRDKDVIILSFVRSNLKGKVGRLLEDFRRLNVAFTRAKCKMIMIGSFSTLHTGSDVLRPVLCKLDQDGKVLKLPSNALSYQI
jgi:DNA replication ATP-dependent helicase Dna2